MLIDWSKIGLRKHVETTYADLRPTDLVIDKAGNAWPIKILGGADEPELTFWLLDSVSDVPTHLMVKPKGDPVTVSRVETAADEAVKLEADFPKSGSPGSSTGSATTSAETVATTSTEAASITQTADVAASLKEAGVSEVDMADAVAGVEKILGGTVEADVTSEEIDAAKAATEDEPVQLPAFEDMTILEMRSHLYLLHGVFAHDQQSRDETIGMHTQAHVDHDAGKLKSKHVPHVHAEVK